MDDRIRQVAGAIAAQYVGAMSRLSDFELVIALIRDLHLEPEGLPRREGVRRRRTHHVLVHGNLERLERDGMRAGNEPQIVALDRRLRDEAKRARGARGSAT